MKVSKLVNGMTLINCSAHSTKMSDGTVVEGNPEIAKALTAARVSEIIKDFGNGVKIGKTKFIFSKEQMKQLWEISREVDLVLVPFMTISTLSSMGMRDDYPNVVAYNATPETQRSAPQDKIADIGNFSY